MLPLTTIAEHQEESLSSSLPTPILSPTPDNTMMLAASVPPVVPTPEPPKPPFFIYTVQEGDTAGGLASRFGIATTSILWNNLDLENADSLSLGQQLRIPNSDGIIYEVRLGDTLIDIAGYFGANVQDVVRFPGNNLKNVDDIVENQTVFVPNGKMPAPVVTKKVETPTPDIEPTNPPPVTNRHSSSSGFIWPVTGPISSYFSASHPLGIDIDQFRSPGAPVYAAASGTVTFAGGSSCCSYGLYVVISHGNGLETLYAHLGSLPVSQGAYVEQGQVIGYVGLTGYTTGYHLHFEVHLNGQVVNPLNYLP